MMDYLEKILYMITLIVTLKIISMIILDFKAKVNLTNSGNKLLYGLATRKDLVKLSGFSFILWCLNTLGEIGLSSMKIVSKKLSDDYQVKATVNGMPAYVKFVKLRLKDNAVDEDDYLAIGRPELQKFVGSMEHDNVKIGYIITNGNFTDDAVKYTSTLPNQYYLRIIDGCELTRLHRRNQKQYLVANLDQEV